MIAAGIDIGSNSFRLLINELEKMRPGPVLAKELYSVRLGQGLAPNGVMSPAAMEKGLAALASFKKKIAQFNPETCRACGTEALRQASNRDIFLKQACEILGMPIDIISGSEEAALALNGMLAFMREPLTDSLLLADVGGGSTELVFLPNAENTKTYRSVSLPVGAVNLTEKFLNRQPQNARSEQDTQKHITDILRTALRELNIPDNNPAPQIIGSGGTATALAALDLELTSYDEERVQGHSLPANALENIRQRLAKIPVAKRNLLPGLDQGRGEIILAGIMIYQTLLELAGTPGMLVSDAGLLEGIMLSGAATSNTGTILR